MRKILYFVFVSIFSLSVYGQSLTITAPNGNEYWQVGKTPSITWQSNGLVSNIILEYSTNNGNSWLPIATVSNTTESYEWLIPDTASLQCLVRAKSNTINDTSDAIFEISDDTSSCNIVVLGSSTALGNGATPIENSWVNLYHSAIFQKNTKLNIINLGALGYTTYHILPTGTTIPNGVNITIDENRNITKALSYNPTAIIVNMPSNDTYNGYSVSAQLENYDILNTNASNNSIPIWIATPQPRNSFNASKNQIQTDLRDALFAIYQDKAIDFWNGIADANGDIIASVHAGDGIHVNNLGHEILFERVLNKQIDVLTCLNGSLGIDEIVDNSTINFIKIHPNPATDNINIDFKSETSGELNVEFYDILGRKLLVNNIDFNTGINSINILLKQKNSLSSRIIFAKLMFKTDYTTINKSIKLVLK